MTTFALPAPPLAIVDAGLHLLALTDAMLAGWTMAITRDTSRLTWAAACACAYLAFTVGVLRAHRASARHAREHVREVMQSQAQAPMLVVYASQTGSATELAALTAAALEGGVATAILDLGRVTPETLLQARQVFFVVSTTGEGDPPDHAEPFVRDAMAAPAALSSLQYGILALGDRGYRQYCAFGYALDAWLRASGATPLFDLIDVDDGDPSALARWQSQLRGASGTDISPWNAPSFEPWRLVQRTLANPGSPGGPAYHVVLEGAPGVTWKAGDVAVIAPAHPESVVTEWLGGIGHDGDQLVLQDEGTSPLRHALVSRALPGDEATRAELGRLDPQELVARLPCLPPREYSIASVPDTGRVSLLVRQLRLDNGRLGLGSGWLTAHASLGSPVQMRIRENAAFHVPTVDCPCILIGNGTGIAGLRAHLAQRAAEGRHRNWLLFGERSRAHDYHYQEDIERWQRDGVLTRVDLAFSRDPDDRRYVQDLVRAADREIRRWVAGGAAIYVCGSLEGMAAGVDAALAAALGPASLRDLAAQGRYRRDVY